MSRKVDLPPNVSTEVLEGFHSLYRIDPITKCWNWRGSLDQRGYGYFWDGRQVRKAHRYAYEALVELIPTGLTIDHLCENKACVNPKHLEPVTRKVNTQRLFSRADPNWKTPEQAQRELSQLSTELKRCRRGHFREVDQPACRLCQRDNSRKRQKEARKARNLRRTSPEVAEAKRMLLRRNA